LALENDRHEVTDERKSMEYIRFEELIEILNRHKMGLPDKQTDIGLDIAYHVPSKRSMDIIIVPDHEPNYISAVLECVLSISEQWILIPRFGFSRINLFHSKHEEDIALRISLTKLTDHMPKIIDHLFLMEHLSDDITFINNSGDCLIRIDHHLFDDGVGLYSNSIDKTNEILQRLNTLGVEMTIYYS